MKNNSIIRIVLYSVLILVLVGLLIGGILLHGFSALTIGALVGDDSIKIGDDSIKNGTAVHSGSVDPSGISQLEIEWVDGNITVLPGDTEQILFEESGYYKEPMVYKVNGSELKIQFCRNRKIQFGIPTSIPSKDLTVTIPRQWIAGKISVETVSGQVNLSDLTMNELDVEIVSARCDLKNIQAGSLDANTVSGNVTFMGSANELSIEGVSANMKATLTNCPYSIELDGVSGDLDLELLEECGFRVEMDTATGNFNCDLPVVTQRKNVYTYGDGRCQIDIDCVSGDLNLRTVGKADS